VIAAFGLTRLAMAILAGNPDWYTGSGLAVTPYVYGSREWALQVVAHGVAPYVGAPLEYPPGLLPFILVPAWLLDSLRVPYLPSFVVLMAAVDALGLIGLWRLSNHWGSRVGPWLWVIGLAILGPMVLLRLDLVPAVATIWSLERIASGAPAAGGGFLGFGALAKIYPSFLLPETIALVAARWRFAVGVLVVVLVGLLPFVLSLDAVIASVAGFHLERGIQIESLWGNGLLIARAFGYDAGVRRAFGSWDVIASVSPMLASLSTAFSVGVVASFTWWARRRRLDSSGRPIATIWFATLACLLVTGRVLSPQYLIWTIGLGAAATCAADGLARRTIVALLGAALLTHVGFPFLFAGLIEAQPSSVAVLTARNVCLALVAVSAIADVPSREQG
jgi:hypothetical protein